LVGERDAGDNAHREGHGENLRPETREAMEVLAAGAFPQHEQGSDVRGQADGKGRKDDVEADGERELEAGEQPRRGGHLIGPDGRRCALEGPGARPHSTEAPEPGSWALCPRGGNASGTDLPEPKAPQEGCPGTSSNAVRCPSR